jgi:hypothetical protein
LLYADDIVAQILKVRVNFNREMTNYCFVRFIKLKVESEVVEVVLREAVQNCLIVGHAGGNYANPGSYGPQ